MRVQLLQQRGAFLRSVVHNTVGSSLPNELIASMDDLSAPKRMDRRQRWARKRKLVSASVGRTQDYSGAQYISAVKE
jgi:hypothetical protein